MRWCDDTMRKTNIHDIVGAGPLGYGLCLLLFATAWKIDRVLKMVFLPGDQLLYDVLGGILLFAGAAVFLAAFRAMPISKHNKTLITDGVYSYVRHPRYAACVLLVYPAFAFLINSTLCLISTIAAYLIFRSAAVLEERKLISVFGQDYRNYMKETPAFIPKIHRRQ